jgi:hypothetical protein
LIINNLCTKTHENTGNKPAKPEMNNKPNMNRNNHKHLHPYNPHPENQINQMNQWFRQTPNRKMPSYLSVAIALREGYRQKWIVLIIN